MKSFGSLILFLIALVQTPVPSVRGRILDDISRQPVANAQLELTGPELSRPRVAFTDERGNFTIVGLPPGRYLLKIEALEFFPKQTDVFSSIDALGVIELIRKRSISGFVQWRDGEPAVGAIAGVLFQSDSNGLTPLINGTARTNDSGEFQIRDLQPGRYVLYALPPFKTERDPQGRMVNSIARRASPDERRHRLESITRALKSRFDA